MDEDMIIPDLATLSKLYYSTTLTGEKTQIALTEELPAFEESADAITGTAVDIDYEFSKPGKKKATDVEVNIYYTHSQHKALKALEGQDLYFFCEYPESSADDGEEPLVEYFKGQIQLTRDTLTSDEWIKDIMKIYRSTQKYENYGFPTTE